MPPEENKIEESNKKPPKDQDINPPITDGWGLNEQNVIPPVVNNNSPQQLPEADLGINKLKEEITTLKKDAQALEALRSDFESRKDNLPKEENEKIKQEIDAKAKYIEETKQRLLDQIKQWELAVLKWNVIDSALKKAQLDASEKEILAIQGEKKNVFKKVGEWAVEHKTGLLIGWGIAAGFLLLRRRFKGKKKEEKEGGDTKEPKFWKRPFGKFLKWTGLGTGAYYLIHGLSTGRRGISDFFNWDKKEKINPADLDSWYKTEVSEALKPKYEAFGTNVDAYRKWIWNTDSLWMLKDDENKEVAIPKWAIPASMDNAYDNVKDILDTNDDIKETWARVGQKVWGLVGELGGKIVSRLFRPFIWRIKWLTPQMFGGDGIANAEFQQWAETEDITRDEQVANLMQKYSMVRSYLNDKRKQLKRKYIVEQLKVNGVNNPTEKQILDYDQNDNLIEERIERDFLSKKIVSAEDSNSASVALAWLNIYDAVISPETEAVIKEVKEIRKTIVPNEAIRASAKGSADINKDDALRLELGRVSKNFGGHLKEWILHRNILEWIANGFGILNLDELRNSKADDLEEAIESLGFGKEVKRFQLENQDFYTKLQNKTLTQDDITKFEKTINDYFSLLQQVLLERETQQENESGLQVSTWFLWRMWDLISTPWWRVIIWSTVVLSKSKRARQAVKWTRNTTTKPLKWITRPGARKINIPTILGNKYLKNAGYGSSTTWYDHFVDDVKKWGMSYDEAKYVFDKHQKYPNWKDKGATWYFSEFLEKELHLSKVQIRTLETHLNNKNIRKILSKSDTSLRDLADKLKTYDDKLKLLVWEQKVFCEKLWSKAIFTKLDDIDIIVRNIDQINIAWMTDEIVKSLGKDISKFTTADQINAYIKAAKNSTNIAGGTVDALTLVNKTQAEDMIARSLKSSRTVDGYPGEFKAGSQLDDPKYASFKTEYENAKKLTTKAKRDLKYAAIDKRLAEKLFADKHPMAIDIVNKNIATELWAFTTEQKKVYQVVVKDIDDLTAVINKQLPKMSGYTPNSPIELYYKAQLSKLQDFRYNIKWFQAGEIKAFEQMTTLKFKPVHIAELFELWNNNTQIKNVLSTGWDSVEDLLKVINRESKALETSGMKISKWLIEWLENIQKMKNAAKAGDAIYDTIKTLFQFVAKVT